MFDLRANLEYGVLVAIKNASNPAPANSRVGVGTFRFGAVPAVCARPIRAESADWLLHRDLGELGGSLSTTFNFLDDCLLLVTNPVESSLGIVYCAMARLLHPAGTTFPYQFDEFRTLRQGALQTRNHRLSCGLGLLSLQYNRGSLALGEQTACRIDDLMATLETRS